MNVIGQRIVTLRNYEGWSQRELAKRLNLKTHTMVVYWETGRTEPSASNLKLLADVFNVSADYLLGRTNDF